MTHNDHTSSIRKNERNSKRVNWTEPSQVIEESTTKRMKNELGRTTLVIPNM